MITEDSHRPVTAATESERVLLKMVEKSEADRAELLDALKWALPSEAAVSTHKSLPVSKHARAYFERLRDARALIARIEGEMAS